MDTANLPITYVRTNVERGQGLTPKFEFFRMSDPEDG